MVNIENNKEINESILLYYSMLMEPKLSFDYLNRHKVDSHGIPFEARKYQVDYEFGLTLNNSIVIAGGRSVSKSFTIAHYVFKWSITHSGLSCGIIVKNEVHARGLINYLNEYFTTSEFTNFFYVSFDKKNRTFHLSNSNTIEFRIAGSDRTGGTTLVAGHFNFLIIDEAQLMYATTLPELLPMLKKGGKLMVTGVPNNIRDRILYRYCCDPDTIYYKYTSIESVDWDEDKEKEFLKMYKGGKESDAWKSLILAQWNDAASSVFRPSKLAENLKEIDFHFNKYDLELFSDFIGKVRLPIINPKYEKYIIGSDSGYTERSPMHVVILGQYKLKSKIDGEIKERDHYDCVCRIELSGMLSYEASKVLDYLLTYFNSMYCAIDAQNYGANIYANLTNKEIFPSTWVRNSRAVLQIIFGDAVVIGEKKSIDVKTGKEIIVDDKKAIKCATTDKLVELIENDRFHISTLDQGGLEFEDLYSILECEVQTQTPTNNKLHPVKYSNSKNDHAVDACRACAYVIMQIIENGINLKNRKRTPLRPLRYKSGHEKLQRRRYNHG